jgi:hypothetical protein
MKERRSKTVALPPWAHKIVCAMRRNVNRGAKDAARREKMPIFPRISSLDFFTGLLHRADLSGDEFIFG